MKHTPDYKWFVNLIFCKEITIECYVKLWWTIKISFCTGVPYSTHFLLPVLEGENFGKSLNLSIVSFMAVITIAEFHLWRKSPLGIFSSMAVFVIGDSFIYGSNFY